MAHRARLTLFAFVVLIGLVTGPRMGSPAPAAAGVPIVGWLVPSLGRLASLVSPPGQGLIEGRRLQRDDGWTDLRWQPNEPILGLYVEVEGRVRFREAAILFADGDAIHLDLRRAVRPGGLFALIELDASRDVAQVAVMAEAVSGEAEVALRIMPARPTPPGGAEP
jgi:hypothetical protein